MLAPPERTACQKAAPREPGPMPCRVVFVRSSPLDQNRASGRPGARRPRRCASTTPWSCLAENGRRGRTTVHRPSIVQTSRSRRGGHESAVWRYEIALTRPRETVLNEDAGTTGADGVSGRVMTRGGVMIHYTTHACKLGHVDTWYAAERGSLMLLTRWRGADMGHADRLTCTFTEWCSLLRARAPSDRCCVHAPRRHHPIELRSIA